MLVKGFDDPATGCIVIARPTKSLMLHYQILGRVLRIFGGKFDGIIIDHAGNLLRNGLPTDTLPDRLDMGDGDPVDRAKKDTNPDKADQTKPCPKCSFVLTGLLCTKCGFEIKIDAGVEVAAGLLVKVADRKSKIADRTKQHTYAELLGYAQLKGKSPMWAQTAYQALMAAPIQREWANSTNPTPPGEPIQQWVKGFNVRRAKSKKRA